MANFKYEIGDVTNLKGESNDAKIWCCHIVNDENIMGGGVAYALAKKWPKVKEAYHKWVKMYGEELAREEKTPKHVFKLGRIQPLGIVGYDLNIINMVAQSDCGGYNNFPPIRYQSLEECLMRVKKLIKDVNRKADRVVCPLFGSVLAGGDWMEITGIVRRVFNDMDIDWTWYCLTAEEKEEAEKNDWNNTKTAPAIWTNCEA